MRNAKGQTRVRLTDNCCVGWLGSITASPDRLSMQSVLKQYFQFEQFRYPQAEVIERTLAGGHSLVILPTGGGKSLCFQIPALIFYGDAEAAGVRRQRPLTLVLSPLISLMKDQVDRSESVASMQRTSTLRSTANSASSDTRVSPQASTACCMLLPNAFAKANFARCWLNARSNCWRSMKRIASANGVTTSGPTIR